MAAEAMAEAGKEEAGTEKAGSGTGVGSMAEAGVPGARLLGWQAGRTVAEAREEAAREVALLEEEVTVETAESEVVEALAAPQPEWRAERKAAGCLASAEEETEAEGSVEAQREEAEDTGARPTEPPAETRAAGWGAEQAEGMAAAWSVGTERSAAAGAPGARPRAVQAEREGAEEDQL